MDEQTKRKAVIAVLVVAVLGMGTALSVNQKSNRTALVQEHAKALVRRQREEPATADAKPSRSGDSVSDRRPGEAKIVRRKPADVRKPPPGRRTVRDEERRVKKKELEPLG